MANPANSDVQNLLPVQALFNLDNSFNTFIGQGQPFFATINPSQSGLNITSSTINSTTIGATTPSTGVFTNITTTTGTIFTTPSNSTDIANKAYVDATSQGLAFKQPANFTTTGNITLSGLAVQANGDWTATLTAGNRILVKNQTAGAENGIYLASAIGWTRSLDANTWDELVSSYLFIISGTVWTGSSWVNTNQTGGTLGTTPVTFVQFSNNAIYTAGTGLTLAGFQFSITPVGTAGTYGSASSVPVFVTNASGQVTSVTNTSIAIAANQITSGTIDTARISGSYTGITGVGTLTAGTWNASTIGVAYGGSGATTFTAGYLKANGTAAFTTVASIPSSDITGLGTMSTQNANNVAITGGTIATLTSPIAVASGGTGASTLTGYVKGTGTAALTASATIPSTDITGFGTMASQNANSVAITGGSINATAIGATTPSTGAFTTGAFTTITASTSLTTPIVQATNSGGLSLKNSAGTTQMSMGAGGGDNISLNVSTNLNGTNAQIDISPTGTGHVHIKPSGSGAIEIAPTSVGTIDNMTIGATTAKNGSFVDLSVTGTTSFDGSQGSIGQVLTSAGSGNTPTWATPASSITLSDDTTTNATRYPLYAAATSGTISTEYVSSTKLQFNPSTGVLTSTSFSGAGTGLTGTASGLSIGGNAATATSATTATNLAGGANGSVPYQTGAGATTFLAAGTNGYVMTLAAGVPTWAAAASSGITISDDTTTNATRYLTFTSATSGSITSENVSSTKLNYNPSKGELTAPEVIASNGILINGTTVSASYTIASGNNGFSVGPITVASGQAVTVTSGQRWLVL